MHGGVDKKELSVENVEAVQAGLVNLARHLENLKKFGVPAIVAINHFITDTDAEMKIVEDYCAGRDVQTVRARHWSEGGAGAEELATKVAQICDSGAGQFRPLYDDDLPIWEKIETIAREIYRADEVLANAAVRKQIARLQKTYSHFPICMAKTQYSFSTDPNLKGAPSGHSLTVREVRLSAGAEFLVVVTGDIMTMPGLPREPAANNIHLDEAGLIQGLF